MNELIRYPSTSTWLPWREAVDRVARHLGYPFRGVSDALLLTAASCSSLECEVAHLARQGYYVSDGGVGRALGQGRSYQPRHFVDAVSELGYDL